MLDYLKETLHETFAPIAIVGLALVIYGSFAKTKWGINLRPPKECPRCGGAIGRVRSPRSAQQAFWGGWTCSSCGAELDKWGREASAPESAATRPD